MSLSPLVKWTGGKRSELPVLVPLFPPFKRIVEPFCGGAAVSFHVQAPKTVLNDASQPLISFYKTIKSQASKERFFTHLETINSVRKEIKTFVERLPDKKVQEWFAAPENKKKALMNRIESAVWWNLLPQDLRLQAKKDAVKSTMDKTQVRIPALLKKNSSTVFSVSDLRQHLETGLQSGFYTLLRRIYNKEKPFLTYLGKNPEMLTAAWFAVRSLCYSGMFRYGKNGALNVPYGGIGYNTRVFNMGVFKNKKLVKFFKSTSLSCGDFQKLFEEYDYFNQDDFVFLDPPYDSAFSQYNPEGDFDAKEQKRLSEECLKLKSPWMMVIKNTPFILSLYDKPGLHHAVFGKNYQVNFRNRHDRGVEHLIITNYPLPVDAEGIAVIDAKTHFASSQKPVLSKKEAVKKEPAGAAKKIKNPAKKNISPSPVKTTTKPKSKATSTSKKDNS